jgi:hypothetical protein
VKDAQDAPAYGRTNWRRFALAAVIPAVAAVGVMAGVAQGAIPASFVVSGTPFKLSANKLDGQGFTQYSGVTHTKIPNKVTGTTTLPLAVSGIKSADIYNLCQTVAVGPIVLRIEAGTDANNPAHADDLLIGMSDLRGTATFGGIDIGMDASELSKDQAKGEHGDAGGFGQQADTVVIDNLQQTAYTTSASTFRLTNMNLKLSVGNGKECF